MTFRTRKHDGVKVVLTALALVAMGFVAWISVP
jgi:hypothetical protein